MAGRDKFQHELDAEIKLAVESMVITLQTQAEKTALTLKEYIRNAQIQGIGDDLIYDKLIDDFVNEGRIFGEFRRNFKTTTTGRMAQIADRASFAEYGVKRDSNLMWVAVLKNTCPDCFPRHGEVDTLTNWQLRGEPKTGWSVCRTNCNCVLVPIEKTSDLEVYPFEPVNLKK